MTKTKPEKQCECGCGSEAQVMHTDLYQNYKYLLCKNCEVLFVNNALTPEMFKSMIENGHSSDEFMLHSDFYDEDTGEAIQPRM